MPDNFAPPSAPATSGSRQPDGGSDHRAYAEWFVWAHRNLSGSAEVCHACAQAAVRAIAEGQDPQEAARQASRYRHGPGWATPADPFTLAYAEWFDWGRKHLGTEPAGHHRAAAAAMSVLDRGGDSHAAAEAAQAAAQAPMSEPLAKAEVDAPQMPAPGSEHTPQI